MDLEQSAPAPVGSFTLTERSALAVVSSRTLQIPETEESMDAARLLEFISEVLDHLPVEDNARLKSALKSMLPSILGTPLLDPYARDEATSQAIIDDLLSASAEKDAEAPPTPNADISSSLSRLFFYLQSQAYQQYSDFLRPNDIHLTVFISRLMVACIPSGGCDQAMMLREHAANVLTRFISFGEEQLADLDEAIYNARRCIQLTSQGHPDMAICSSILNSALQARDGLLRSQIASPVDAEKQQLRVDPDGNRQVGSGARGSSSMSLSVVQSAIAAHRRSVNPIPNNGPFFRSSVLRDLGSAYHARLRILPPTRSTLAMGFRYLMDVTIASSSTRNQKLGAALENAAMCSSFRSLVPEPDMILRAHQAVIDTIPSYVWLGRSVPQRYRDLAQINISIAIASAAACAIDAGEPRRGMEWLEEGHNIIWGQLLRLRNPLDKLRDVHPEIADKFARVSAEIDIEGRRFDDSTHDTLDPSGDEAVIAADGIRANPPSRHELALRYESLLGDIRKLEGFESFLRPKTLSELSPACKGGPVAILNVCDSRCDALVLCAPSRVVHVALPNLTLEKAEAMHKTVMKATSGRYMRGAEDERGPIARREMDDGLETILEALWDWVVQPVLNGIVSELKQHAEGGLPHMTWCVSGPLTFVPIHAAGVYSATRVKNRPWPHRVSDVVVSSYTRSLSALIPSSPQRPRKPAQAAPVPHILVVSQASTPEQTPLPYTVDEANAIRRHFPNTVLHLNDKQALVHEVYDAMEKHDCVHLACHGVQNSGDPTKSAFLLHDGHLELVKLMSLSHSRAELAVLSACQTAQGDEYLPAEAVHLAAGMLAAGYKSVVATMWSIMDADGPVLTDALYAALKENLKKDGDMKVARALHEAVGILRSKIGEKNFVRWVPFVHFGM